MDKRDTPYQQTLCHYHLVISVSLKFYYYEIRIPGSHYYTMCAINMSGLMAIVTTRQSLRKTTSFHGLTGDPKSLRHCKKLSWILTFLKVLSTTPDSGTGADPEFFLGGGALVSCSTSTPINHIVFFFFRGTPVVLENRRSSQVGVRTPCTLPLNPPLRYIHCKGNPVFIRKTKYISYFNTLVYSNIMFMDECCGLQRKNILVCIPVCLVLGKRNVWRKL